MVRVLNPQELKYDLGSDKVYHHNQRNQNPEIHSGGKIVVLVAKQQTLVDSVVVPSLLPAFPEKKLLTAYDALLDGTYWRRRGRIL